MPGTLLALLAVIVVSICVADTRIVIYNYLTPQSRVLVAATLAAILLAVLLIFMLFERETLVKLAVKDGAIPEEFFRYSQEMHRKRTAGEPISQEETDHLQQLRVDLSKAILAADSNDLFVLLEA